MHLLLSSFQVLIPQHLRRRHSTWELAHQTTLLVLCPLLHPHSKPLYWRSRLIPRNNSDQIKPNQAQTCTEFQKSINKKRLLFQSSKRSSSFQYHIWIFNPIWERKRKKGWNFGGPIWSEREKEVSFICSSRCSILSLSLAFSPEFSAIIYNIIFNPT